jgi:hypothetical protein
MATILKLIFVIGKKINKLIKIEIILINILYTIQNEKRLQPDP